MSDSVEQIGARAGVELQKLEDLLASSGDSRTKIRFPRGFLRTASHFRQQFWFIRNDTLRRNIAYSLILSDVYRWILNRTDLWGTAREMLIKEGVCLIGCLTESITKDAMHDHCGKHQSYAKRVGKMLELSIIDKRLRHQLDLLWEYRNREHLFLVKSREYGQYTLKHYNDAIRTIRRLREALDRYFRDDDIPF